MSAQAPKLCQTEAGKFRRTCRILCAALVMDGELLTSQNTVVRISNEFEPERCGGGMLATAFGEKSKLATRARAEFSRQVVRTGKILRVAIPTAMIPAIHPERVTIRTQMDRRRIPVQIPALDSADPPLAEGRFSEWPA